MRDMTRLVNMFSSFVCFRFTSCCNSLSTLFTVFTSDFYPAEKLFVLMQPTNTHRYNSS